MKRGTYLEVNIAATARAADREEKDMRKPVTLADDSQATPVVVRIDPKASIQLTQSDTTPKIDPDDSGEAVACVKAAE